MYSAHIVIAEVRRGVITQESYEAVSFARDCSGGLLPAVVLLGKDVSPQAEGLAEKTGCTVHVIQGDHLGSFNAEESCAAIADLISGLLPALVCLPHSSMGWDLAPRLAVKLHASCITAVETVKGKGFTRSMCAGRFMADIVPLTESVVITLSAGAYPPYSPGGSAKGPIERVRAAGATARSRLLGVREPAHRDSALRDAEVIVSAGRGIGKKENVEIVRELASLFPRSAVGASRSVCDLGWLEYGRQIGTTGQTVAPKLYIACGISGAIQHVAGMRGAHTIVAINTDPDAAIFRVAHYCIVEDITTFIPVLMDELKRD